MLVVLAILSVGLLGLIIYHAFSPKSSRPLKIAAFIAMGLIALSLGISAIFLIIGPGEDPGGIPLPIFADTPQPMQPDGHIVEALIFLAIFFIVMALIIVFSVRDRRKKEEAFNKKPEKPPAFTKTDILNKVESKSESKNRQNGDFDLELDFNDDN